MQKAAPSHGPNTSALDFLTAATKRPRYSAEVLTDVMARGRPTLSHICRTQGPPVGPTRLPPISLLPHPLCTARHTTSRSVHRCPCGAATPGHSRPTPCAARCALVPPGYHHWDVLGRKATAPLRNAVRRRPRHRGMWRTAMPYSVLPMRRWSLALTEPLQRPGRRTSSNKSRSRVGEKGTQPQGPSGLCSWASAAPTPRPTHPHNHTHTQWDVAGPPLGGAGELVGPHAIGALTRGCWRGHNGRGGGGGA